MSLSLSRKKRVLIFLMAGCLFMSITVHTVAASFHPVAPDCKIKSICWACAVTLRSDSAEINLSQVATPYYSETIIASPMIVPEPFYHPPR